MKELILYALKVLASSGVLLAVYAILLEKRVKFRWCRIYLLTAMVVAALIPLLSIPVWPGKVIEVPVITVPDTQMDWSAEVIADEPTGPVITAEMICGAIYLLGASLILGVMVWQTLRIRNLRRGAQIVHTGRFTLVRTQQKIASFSFFRSVYVWQNTPEEELPAILAHEQSHIAHHHSVERIAMECIKAALWWNPFVWIAARRLTQAEEFEADNDVLTSGFDLENYMNTIFKQLFGYSPEIANGLRDSLTKKRFQMMTTKTPGRHGLLRLAGTLPALIGLLCAFSFTSRAAIVKMPDGNADKTLVDQVILLNGKPASVAEVYQLDPASIDTMYVLTGNEILTQYNGLFKGVAFVHRIDTKGAPRKAKLITLQGRVHYPDGKPVAGFNVFASSLHYITASTQSELERLGAVTDAQGRYTLKAPAKGDLWGHNTFCSTMSTYDSEGKNPYTRDIEVNYPDSAKWKSRVESDGSITLLPEQRAPALRGAPEVTVIERPNGQKSQMGSVSLKLYLKDKEGYDANRKPADGAIVKIVGSDKGVTTDAKGEATIEAPVGSILEIMYIGYETTTVTVNAGASSYLLPLLPEGMAQPTQTPIFVRDNDGVKQRPLYIIDGVEYSDINDIDASQIENMTVMQDNKAIALYGERGRNGVVFITTKSMAQLKAMQNEKPKTTTDVTFDQSTGANREQEIDDTAPFLVAETMPLFRGENLHAFRAWVQQNVKYPVAALNNKIQGRVVLSFVIEKDGSINKEQIHILQSPDKSLSDEARRVIASTPAGSWSAGMQQGQKVRIKYTLPVDFRITGNDKPTDAAAAKSDDKQAFLVAETMPEFQGGDLNTYRTWLQSHVRFPKAALDNNIAGRVVAAFVVEKDGSVSSIEILQSPDKSLSDEARRVIASTPAGAWTPGKQKGQAVRVRYTIPVDFRVMTETKTIQGKESPKPQTSATTAEEITVVGYGTDKK